MDYDTWKTGLYDADPEIDYEEYCPHEHEYNRKALEELIDALHDENKLNIEFFKEQLHLLANDYSVDFDFNNPMNIEAKIEEKPVTFISEQDLFRLSGEWLKKNKALVNLLN